MGDTRKIAAILVTDVVGYSRLASADEDRTLSRLRRLRSDLIDPAIATYRCSCGFLVGPRRPPEGRGKATRRRASSATISASSLSAAIARRRCRALVRIRPNALARSPRGGDFEEFANSLEVVLDVDEPARRRASSLASCSWPRLAVRADAAAPQSFATVLSEELERIAGVLVRQAHPRLSDQEIKEAAGRAGHGVGRLNAVAGEINSLADNASEAIFDEVAKRCPRAIEVSSDHCIAPCIHTLTRPALPTRGASSTSITR